MAHQCIMYFPNVCRCSNRNLQTVCWILFFICRNCYESNKHLQYSIRRDIEHYFGFFQSRVDFESSVNDGPLWCRGWYFKNNITAYFFWSFLFSFQMKTLGRSFNYSYHKKYFLTTISIAVMVTDGLIFYSFISFRGILTIYASFAYIAYIVLTCAHLVLTFLFAFLLINVKIRFRMLNQFLR